MLTGAVGATGASAGDDVDTLVARLQQDPVLIDPVLGNGHTDEVAQAVRESLGGVDVPVFVVMTSTPGGLDPVSADEELASILHGRLGGDGVYVVQTTDGAGHIGVWGDLDPTVDNDATLLSLARYTARDEVRESLGDACGEHCRPHPVADAALVAEVLARGPGLPDYEGQVLTPERAAVYTEPMWLQGVDTEQYLERVDEPGAGLPAMLWTSVGIVVAVVAYLALRAVQERRSLPPAVDGVDALREQVRRELVSAERALGRRGLDDDRRERARASHEAAERLVDSTDRLDLVGALVLVRTAGHLADRRGGEEYRPCYVNPLHGRARHRADLGSGLAVPVCEPCAADLRRGRPGDPLVEVRRGAVDRPYYRGDTVWARTGFGAIGPELWRQLLDERGRR